MKCNLLYIFAFLLVLKKFEKCCKIFFSPDIFYWYWYASGTGIRISLPMTNNNSIWLFLFMSLDLRFQFERDRQTVKIGAFFLFRLVPLECHKNLVWWKNYRGVWISPQCFLKHKKFLRNLSCTFVSDRSRYKLLTPLFPLSNFILRVTPPYLFDLLLNDPKLWSSRKAWQK